MNKDKYFEALKPILEEIEDATRLAFYVASDRDATTLTIRGDAIGKYRAAPENFRKILSGHIVAAWVYVDKATGIKAGWSQSNQDLCYKYVIRN